jgi:hypothetical protein
MFKRSLLQFMAFGVAVLTEVLIVFLGASKQILG